MKSSFSTTNHYTHLSINKRQIKLDSTIKPFDCGVDNLNEFLLPLLNPLHKPKQLKLSLV